MQQHEIQVFLLFLKAMQVLASYHRADDRQVYFGKNLVYSGTGEVSVGDTLEILE